MEEYKKEKLDQLFFPLTALQDQSMFFTHDPMFLPFSSNYGYHCHVVQYDYEKSCLKITTIHHTRLGQELKRNDYKNGLTIYRPSGYTERVYMDCVTGHFVTNVWRESLTPFVSFLKQVVRTGGLIRMIDLSNCTDVIYPWDHIFWKIVKFLHSPYGSCLLEVRVSRKVKWKNVGTCRMSYGYRVMNYTLWKRRVTRHLYSIEIYAMFRVLCEYELPAENEWIDTKTKHVAYSYDPKKKRVKRIRIKHHKLEN
jgi:hypothetical protein